MPYLGISFAHPNLNFDININFTCYVHSCYGFNRTGKSFVLQAFSIC